MAFETFLEASKQHLAGAKAHLEKGRAFYSLAQEREVLSQLESCPEDKAEFESAGNSFALAIDELNKVHALQDLGYWLEKAESLSLQQEHRSMTLGAFLNLAQCNLKACHFQAALENCDQVLQLQRNGLSGAKAFYRKATALEALGREVEALPLWRAALQEAPEDAAIRRCLATALGRRKERQQWECKASQGIQGASKPFSKQKAEKLRMILERVSKTMREPIDELFGICESLEAEGVLKVHEIQQLTAVFNDVVCGACDLELSSGEVSFLESLGISLLQVDLDARARVKELLRRLEMGKDLSLEDAQFLRAEQSKLESLARGKDFDGFRVVGFSGKNKAKAKAFERMK